MNNIIFWVNFLRGSTLQLKANHLQRKIGHSSYENPNKATLLRKTKKYPCLIHTCIAYSICTFAYVEFSSLHGFFTNDISSLAFMLS